MVALIDKTIFTGSISLPISADSQDETLLNELIIEKQDYYLTKFLGAVELYNLQTDIAILGTGVATAQKWIDFLTGKDIVLTDKNGEDKTVHYDGFKTVLSFFVFYEYVKAYNEQMTSVGNVIQEMQNSTPSYPYRKLVNSYNTGIDKYGIDWENDFVSNSYFKYYYTSYFSSYEKWSINYNVERLRPTAYNFMQYMNGVLSTNFPDWQFQQFEGKINEFNI